MSKRSSQEFEAARHPTRYVWDFWYHFDEHEGLFHVLYLNADPALVATDDHHWSARVGYCTTRDFMTITWISDDFLSADPAGWDNSSIWTGDIIRMRDRFVIFYTSRDAMQDDGLTQNIGAAWVRDLKQWQDCTRLRGFRLRPEAPYELRSLAGDSSIHAWRDPFLFIEEGDAYMLLSAKSRTSPLGRKGAIAILRCIDGNLSRWTVLDPVLDSGWYSEMEVPQLYRTEDGAFFLVWSCWARGDFSGGTPPRGGLHGVRLDSLTQSVRPSSRKVLLEEASGLYACRIVPELGGEIVGFDITGGGIRRSGVRTGLRRLNRDFSEFSMPFP